MRPSTTSRSCWRRPELARTEAKIALHVVRVDPRSTVAVTDGSITPQERVALASLPHPRGPEWIASRVAAKECVRRLASIGPGTDRIDVLRDASGVPWASVGRRRFPLSLSHASGWAVAAAHARRRVGVDVEPLRPLPPRFSRYFLRSAEAAVLEPWGHRPTASLAAWTVKEAVLKAMGRGLSVPPRAVRIRSMETDGDMTVTAPWIEASAACWREGDAVVAVAWTGTSKPPTPCISRSEM